MRLRRSTEIRFSPRRMPPIAPARAVQAARCSGSRSRSRTRSRWPGSRSAPVRSPASTRWRSGMRPSSRGCASRGDRGREDDRAGVRVVVRDRERAPGANAQPVRPGPDERRLERRRGRAARGRRLDRRHRHRRRRLDPRPQPLQRHRRAAPERAARPRDRLLADDARHGDARHGLRRADGAVGGRRRSRPRHDRRAATAPIRSSASTATRATTAPSRSPRCGSRSTPRTESGRRRPARRLPSGRRPTRSSWAAPGSRR